MLPISIAALIRKRSRSSSWLGSAVVVMSIAPGLEAINQSLRAVSVDVAGRWQLSATLEILRAIAEGRGPTRWVVALGYAGWGSGQLDEEMTRHGWFATPGDEALLYDCGIGARWETAFKGAGIDPRLLAAESGSA